ENLRFATFRKLKKRIRSPPSPDFNRKLMILFITNLYLYFLQLNTPSADFKSILSNASSFDKFIKTQLFLFQLRSRDFIYNILLFLIPIHYLQNFCMFKILRQCNPY